MNRHNLLLIKHDKTFILFTRDINLNCKKIVKTLEEETIMENHTVEELRGRFIHRFLDILILGELARKPMSGYDFFMLTSKRFYVTLSPATIYSTLYSMERKGLIEGEELESKRYARAARVYTLTSKGKETLNNILETKEKILSSIEGTIEQMI